jgi:hypothetical protein
MTPGDMQVEVDRGVYPLLRHILKQRDLDQRG